MSSSCLVPQFKCQPDTFLIHFPSSPNFPKHFPRSRRFLFQAQCILSSTSQSNSSSAVLDMEKPQFPTLEASSSKLATNRQWPYVGMVAPSAEQNIQATIDAESLITSDEAVVAAATAEAVALAKAAVKVAKDAVLLAAQAESKTLSISETESPRSKWIQLTEKERNSILGNVGTETGAKEGHPMQNLEQSDDLEPTNEELEDLEKELSNSIAVRSGRQKERKARRAKAAEKAAAGVVTINTGSSRQKKRNEVDYSDPLCFFRGAAGTSRLLTAAEELQLSAGIQDLLKLERLQEVLAERCGCHPTFSQWAAAAGVDQKTLRKRLNYGTLCKDKMIKSNIRLVITIAKKYQGIGLNLQDLVQEGCRGLVKGAEKFDASKGFKFSTYAHWWIKQSVRKSLSDRSRTIRLPFHMVEASYRVKEAKKQLFTENGRHPDDKEVAEATGLSVKKVAAVLQTPKAPGSLDQKIGIDENLKPSEVIADPDAETLEELLMKQFLKQDLEKVLDRLSPRENQVIRWRFGLDDGRMKTLQEIGESMGVSRERVRQIESSAFRKLKNKKRIKHLQQYMIS